jgi:hypothetical protein
MGSRTRLIIALAALTMLIGIGPNTVPAAEQTRQGANRFVGLTFNEPEQTEFLKAVLQSMNLSYTATAKPHGELVEWSSNDPAQELEIQNRVSQFWFISTQCSGMRPPLPNQPARTSLSCRQ